MTFAPGTLVRARTSDPDHHTRIPRYVRGHIGVIVEAQGEYPLADDLARGFAEPSVETVYAVRCQARDLWGQGEHIGTVDLWESDLEAIR